LNFDAVEANANDNAKYKRASDCVCLTHTGVAPPRRKKVWDWKITNHSSGSRHASFAARLGENETENKKSAKGAAKMMEESYK
jgi:hypothetical protein